MTTPPQDPLRTALWCPSGCYRDPGHEGEHRYADIPLAALPPRQDEPGLREALERIVALGPTGPFRIVSDELAGAQSIARAALRAAPAEPQPAVDGADVALFFEPCRDFAAPQSCYTNDGTGLWCATCTERRRVVSGAATEPADGTLDEAWKAAEAALPWDNGYSLGWKIDRLERGDRGWEVSASWRLTDPVVAFGATPAATLLALAAALSKPASPAIAARDGGET